MTRRDSPTTPGSSDSSCRDFRGDFRSQAASRYHLDAWGQGLFGINGQGHVTVTPHGETGPTLDLKALVDDLAQRELTPPLLIRFTDVLHQRIDALADAFARARQEMNYPGDYRAVYPVKVNQQRHVVEEVLARGRSHGFGIEVGSKPELLAILAMVADNDTLIICNGFKDAAFIEAIILAAKLGRSIVPVVEQFSELGHLIEASKHHGVRPRIGLRIKLATQGAGRWQASGGSRSKFGLSLSEVLKVIDLLRQENMLDCLKMLHAHLGSQVNDVQSLKASVTELSRVYVEVCGRGAALEMLDAGGGLGVDYDGSSTCSDSSMNYSLQEYANNIVFHVGQACEHANVTPPTLITESGRAMVAHHSVLILNVLGCSRMTPQAIPDDLDEAGLEALPAPVRTLYETYHNLTADNFIEYFHDSQLNRSEVQSLFSLGYCSLEHCALAQRLAQGIASRVNDLAKQLAQGSKSSGFSGAGVPDELAHLDAMLADTYFCNASIFQSLPDSWAIGQLFPIMPIHRLNEVPDCRGILADITCDSDGKIDRFIGEAVPRAFLPLHPMTDEPYYLGVFLVGAYQEILGDLHNLFGDTNAIHVALGDAGQPIIEEVVEGDTIAEVLGYVQFDPEQLRRSVRQHLERAVREGRLTVAQSQTFRRFYDQHLSHSTYLDDAR